MIKKSFIDNEMINKIDKEIEILMKLKDHPNIVNLKNIRKTQNNIYLIFEYCENGDLEQYLRKQPNKWVSEKEAQNIVR